MDRLSFATSLRNFPELLAFLFENKRCYYFSWASLILL